jgi:hypothetical protein
MSADLPWFRVRSCDATDEALERVLNEGAALGYDLYEKWDLEPEVISGVPRYRIIMVLPDEDAPDEEEESEESDDSLPSAEEETAIDTVLMDVGICPVCGHRDPDALDTSADATLDKNT